MSIRHWSEEVAEAKRIIEPIVKKIDDAVAVSIDGGQGFFSDVVEVELRKAGRRARTVVTFEAWSNAKTDPQEMERAFKEVISDLSSPEGPKSSFVITSAGVERRPVRSLKQTLKDVAALTEAEKEAQQLLKGGINQQ